MKKERFNTYLPGDSSIFIREVAEGLKICMTIVFLLPWSNLFYQIQDRYLTKDDAFIRISRKDITKEEDIIDFINKDGPIKFILVTYFQMTLLESCFRPKENIPIRMINLMIILSLFARKCIHYIHYCF